MNSDWYYDPDFWDSNSTELGPINMDELVSMINKGKLSQEVFVRRDWQDNWKEADTFQEIVEKCPPDLNKLAVLYITAYEADQWPDELWSIQEKMHRWIEYLPEMALELILRILLLNPSKAVLELIAAGPFEDLLDKHSEVIIQQVEAEAKQNLRFRYCLAGVWRRRIPDNIWDRLTLALDTQERY